MSYDGVVPLAIVNGSVTGAKYRCILQKHFLPLVAERQRGRRATILQDDNAPISPSSQRSNILEKQLLPRVPWMASTKSWSQHNTIQNLRMVLKNAISKDSFHQKLFLTCRIWLVRSGKKFHSKLFRLLLSQCKEESNKSLSSRICTKYWKEPQYIFGIICVNEL